MFFSPSGMWLCFFRLLVMRFSGWRMNCKPLNRLSVRSTCWASPDNVWSIQILRDDDTVSIFHVIANSNGHAVDLEIRFKERESHAMVEGNRVAIGRSGHTMHCATAKRSGRAKEMPIEEPSEPLSTSCRMHIVNMEIGLVGIGLRNEPDEERDDLTINDGDEGAFETTGVTHWWRNETREPVRALNDRAIGHGCVLLDHHNTAANGDSQFTAVSLLHPVLVDHLHVGADAHIFVKNRSLHY